MFQIPTKISWHLARWFSSTDSSRFTSRASTTRTVKTSTACFLLWESVRCSIWTRWRHNSVSHASLSDTLRLLSSRKWKNSASAVLQHTPRQSQPSRRENMSRRKTLQARHAHTRFTLWKRTKSLRRPARKTSVTRKLNSFRPTSVCSLTSS